jgi:hypothetical protein
MQDQHRPLHRLSSGDQQPEGSGEGWRPILPNCQQSRKITWGSKIPTTTTNNPKTSIVDARHDNLTWSTIGRGHMIGSPPLRGESVSRPLISGF